MPLLWISKRLLAAMARFMEASKKAASMRCASSKLQIRARILELGLKAAQPKKLPLWLSTRTVSPESAPPLAIALSNIHEWLRSAERSLPSLSRIVFIVSYFIFYAHGDAHRHRPWLNAENPNACTPA